MGDQGHGQDPHKHEHGNKKGGFLNKLFARQGSLKLSGGGHGSSGGGNGEREEEEDGRASSPTRRPDEHPHHHYRFHFPASPLGSSAPTFPSLRHLTGAGVKVTEGVGRGGGDKGGGGLEKGGKGGGGGGGRGKVNSQRLLSPLTPTAVAALKIALDYLGSTALGEEGLYRVSGNKLDVDRLKAVLAAGLLVSSDTLQAHYPDKHVIAGAIKKVLQEHEPLLGYHLYADFVSASTGPPAAMLDEAEVMEEGEEGEGGEEGGSRRRRRSSNLSSSTHSASCSSSGTSNSGLSSSSSKEGRYRGLLLQLRPTSRELLGHLLRHLRRVVARSEQNKMTAENLAVTVGLNLLRKSESVAGVSIQQLERERLVIMDLIALSPSLFPLDGAGNKNKAHPPPKPYHAPRLINSAPASRTPRHFFSLTDEMARRTAPLPATGGGEDDRDVVAPPLFLKPPPKPLGRPHQDTNSSSSSSTTATISTSGSNRPKAISISRSSSGSNSSGGGRSSSSAPPPVAEARTNPLASTLPLRPPDKPMRASPRRASSNESAATSSPALSVSSCNLSTEGKEDEGGGTGREGGTAASNGQGHR